jgi:hypothetical protein
VIDGVSEQGESIDGHIDDRRRDGHDGDDHLRGLGDRWAVARMLAEGVAAILAVVRRRRSVLVGFRAVRGTRRFMAGMTALPLLMRRLAGMRPSKKAEAKDGKEEQRESVSPHGFKREPARSPAAEKSSTYHAYPVPGRARPFQIL